MVSIIIPVYNCEEWVERSIRSALSQTCSEIEVIVVDDGSKDGSGEICDAWALKDNRLKVFHQENGGVNSARRKGVAMASGDWLLFLDSDDFIPENAVETYLKNSGDADIVVSDTDSSCSEKEGYIIDLLTGKITPGPYCKLISAELYRQYQPQLERGIVMGEDLLINIVLALHVDGVRCIPDNLYYINRNNAGSVTKTFKRTWEYEKMYFHTMEDMFLSKAIGMDRYPEVELLVQKSKLNGMKYLMLDGNKVNYADEEFKNLEKYFGSRKGMLGLSERMIFFLKSSFMYRTVLKIYIRLIK